MRTHNHDFFDPRYNPSRRRRQKPTRLEAMMGIDPNRLDRPHYHAQLGCGIKRLDYDYATRVARLYLPDGHCTAFRGAVDLGLAIDDRCVRVETYSGDNLDTVYVRTPGGWDAIWPTVQRGSQ